MTHQKERGLMLAWIIACHTIFWQHNIIVIEKRITSGRFNTTLCCATGHYDRLDMLLRSNNIKTVIMTGCTTEGCVESTARDALFNDYYVVLPEDCVASDDLRQHEASLFLMRHRFDVVSSEDILAIWQRSLQQAHEAQGGARLTEVQASIAAPRE